MGQNFEEINIYYFMKGNCDDNSFISLNCHINENMWFVYNYQFLTLKELDSKCCKRWNANRILQM